MYEFHYGYIKNKNSNNSRLFSDTDSLMLKLKPKMFLKIVRITKCLNLVIFQLSENTIIIELS